MVCISPLKLKKKKRCIYRHSVIKSGSTSTPWTIVFCSFAPFLIPQNSDKLITRMLKSNIRPLNKTIAILGIKVCNILLHLCKKKGAQKLLRGLKHKRKKPQTRRLQAEPVLLCYRVLGKVFNCICIELNAIINFIGLNN